MIDFASPRETAAFVLLALGLVFDLLGCVGLVRLPDVYNRLQAGTKCVTLGTLLLLLGVVVRFGFGAMGWKALLCVWFIAMTSPTGAHAIARAARRQTACGPARWARQAGSPTVTETVLGGSGSISVVQAALARGI